MNRKFLRNEEKWFPTNNKRTSTGYIITYLRATRRLSIIGAHSSKGMRDWKAKEGRNPAGGSRSGYPNAVKRLRERKIFITTGRGFFLQ